MDATITRPDGTGIRSGITPYAMQETSRIGAIRRTLPMTGLVDRLRGAAGT